MDKFIAKLLSCHNFLSELSVLLYVLFGNCFDRVFQQFALGQEQIGK